MTPVNVADLYDAAARCGLLTVVKVGAITVQAGFRAPDDPVLDGLALSRDYQIDYPASWLTLAPSDLLSISGAAYQVRDVRAIGDGSERRAALTRIDSQP